MRVRAVEANRLNLPPKATPGTSSGSPSAEPAAWRATLTPAAAAPARPVTITPAGASGGSQAAEAEATAVEGNPETFGEPQQDPQLGKIYIWKGKAYREKVGAGVNSHHSMEDIYEYASQWPPRRCARRADVAWEVPYESVDDFVNTMRQSSNDGTGAFLWPSERIGIMRAIAVSLHHLPVGHMVSIKNAQNIPDEFYDKNGALRWHALDLYHGTSAFQIPQIMAQGLLPTLGAGCDALERQFGIPVPGVYLAKSWKVATTYPIDATTLPIPQNKNGVAGGSYVSLDGTPPLRAVVRVLADTSQQLWHKGTNQAAYKPSDLHITHVCFYAVHPKLAHTAHRKIELHSYNLDEDTLGLFDQTPTFERTTAFDPESATLTRGMAKPLEPLGTGPHQLRRAYPPMRTLLVTSTQEGGGNPLVETAADSAPSGESQVVEAEGEVVLQTLFHQWLKLHKTQESAHLRE